jgi:VWFA-related protein
MLSLASRVSHVAVMSLALVAIAIVAGGLGHAQAPTPPQQPTNDVPEARQPTFRSGVTLVTTDVIVRDENDQFIADLSPEDFVVYENDVRQEVSSLVRVEGGRVYDVLLEEAPPIQEGIVLPRVQKVDTTAGRIIILFIDDLHMPASLTPKVRQIMGTVRDNLIRDGDLFGIISTGTSNVRTQLTYDRSLLDAATEQILGSGFNLGDMMQLQQRRSLSEIHWRGHTAFKTARETLKNLQRVKNRRKSFLYISAGYDFNPFAESFGQDMPFAMNANELQNNDYQGASEPVSDVIENQGQIFSESELQREIVELTQLAENASTTFHTLDPRGLIAGGDVEYVEISPREIARHMFRTQNSLRALAELTGGIALVNRNSFASGLREIDAETSDYYIIGFNTSRPEADENLTRRLRIEVNREDARVRARDTYTFDFDERMSASR